MDTNSSAFLPNSRYAETKTFFKILINIFTISVDPEEIQRLGKRFRKLDLDNSGSLSIDEFMSLPELQQNPLVQRVIEIFDQDGNGELDFRGLCLLLSSDHLLIDFLQNLLKEFLNLASKEINCRS